MKRLADSAENGLCHGKVTRKQTTGLTDRDHEEHGSKRTEDVDNENYTAIYLFGKYGIWNREKETFISISAYSSRGSHVVPIFPAQSKNTPRDRETIYSA